ncbi:hypothetical protein HK096_008735 [Nowakowskiella sp. JEL0078]|nr:hypothetical protein HK096_008735 [Nowakowskiella sp. JEL0078]
MLPYEPNKLKLSGKPISKDFTLALNEIEKTPEILDYVFELVDVPDPDPLSEPKTPPQKKSRTSAGSSGKKRVRKESDSAVDEPANPTTPTRERRRKSAHGMDVGSHQEDEEYVKPMKRARKSAGSTKTSQNDANEIENRRIEMERAATIYSKKEEAFRKISKRLNKFQKEGYGYDYNDMEKISKLLAQVEGLSYDQEFFRTTKLEKVIRRVRKTGIIQAYPDTNFKILERCQLLYEKWTVERIKIAEASGIKVDIITHKKGDDSDEEDTDDNSGAATVAPVIQTNATLNESVPACENVQGETFTENDQTSEIVTENGKASESVDETLQNLKDSQETTQALIKSIKNSDQLEETVPNVALVQKTTYEIVDSVKKIELESDENMDVETASNEKAVDLSINLKIGTEMEV